MPAANPAQAGWLNHPCPKFLICKMGRTERPLHGERRGGSQHGAGGVTANEVLDAGNVTSTLTSTLPTTAAGALHKLPKLNCCTVLTPELHPTNELLVIRGEG